MGSAPQRLGCKRPPSGNEARTSRAPTQRGARPARPLANQNGAAQGRAGLGRVGAASMKRLLLAAALFLLPFSAYAGPLSSPCTQSGPGAAECEPVNSSNPLPVNRSSIYPIGATAITGNAT